MIRELLNQIVRNEDVRGALSALRASIKEENAYEEAAELIGKGEELLPLLMSEDAKVRKNTAALLGDLQIDTAAEEIFLAYEREETLFVRATLLQALGKMNPSPYLDKLQERYEALCKSSVPENEKKHTREEIRTLEQILRKEGNTIRHTFDGWNKKLAILLTTNPKYTAITADKLHTHQKRSCTLGVRAVVESLRDVVKIRTFRELLFPITLKRDIYLADGAKAFGEALAESKLLALLEHCHKQPAPFYFRLDIKAGLSLADRSRYIKEAAAIIEEESGRKLINAADGYEFEVRLILDKSGKIHVFLKMYTIPMERFSYRQETIAASIQPSTAAMLMELAQPYFKEHAQILDPCCGVGTMLVERHRLLPAREIYGIDTFAEAIEKARINAQYAKMQVNFIHRDYLDFRHKYLFDEIISNMPMRGKRTKEEQDRFYEHFFEKSKTLLAPGGVMILYSNEKGFIRKQLRLHQEWKLYQEHLILEKEQFYLYIIGVSDK